VEAMTTKQRAMILLGAGLFSAALAETDQARISGAVADASGAMIPTAAITVRNLKTGASSVLSRPTNSGAMLL
jgi:hypothetical protein